jgi:hypothetical protein
MSDQPPPPKKTPKTGPDLRDVVTTTLAVAVGVGLGVVATLLHLEPKMYRLQKELKYEKERDPWVNPKGYGGMTN